MLHRTMFTGPGRVLRITVVIVAMAALFSVVRAGTPFIFTAILAVWVLAPHVAMLIVLDLRPSDHVSLATAASTVCALPFYIDSAEAIHRVIPITLVPFFLARQAYIPIYEVGLYLFLLGMLWLVARAGSSESRCPFCRKKLPISAVACPSCQGSSAPSRPPDQKPPEA